MVLAYVVDEVKDKMIAGRGGRRDGLERRRDLLHERERRAGPRRAGRRQQISSMIPSASRRTRATSPAREKFIDFLLPRGYRRDELRLRRLCDSGPPPPIEGGEEENAPRPLPRRRSRRRRGRFLRGGEITGRRTIRDGGRTERVLRQIFEEEIGLTKPIFQEYN